MTIIELAHYLERASKLIVDASFAMESIYPETGAELRKMAKALDELRPEEVTDGRQYAFKK